MVWVCHQQGIGASWKKFSLLVNSNAVNAHINHGDSLGKCDDLNDRTPPEITLLGEAELTIEVGSNLYR